MLSFRNYLMLLLKLLISGILLYFVFKIIEFNNVKKELLSLDYLYLSFSIIVCMISLLLTAIRWKCSILIFNKEISTRELLVYTFIGKSFSLVTPGRIGEIVKTKFLTKKTGLGYIKSITSVAIEKIFDFAAMLLLALSGLLFYSKNIPQISAKMAVILLIAYISFLFFLYAKFKNFNKIGHKIAKKILGRSVELKVNKKLFLEMLSLSAAIWILNGVQAFLILKSLSSEVPIYFVAIAVPVLALASMIPIAIGGIGVREIISIYVFSNAGLNAGESASFSLIYTFTGLGLPAVIGAVFYLLRSHSNREKDSFK